MTMMAKPAPLALTLWRDHDPEVLDLPGVAMGTVPATGDPIAAAAAFARSGVRRVALSEPVDLSDVLGEQDRVQTMVLLRELTGWGIVIDWQLRAAERCDLLGRLNYLYPPADLLGRTDAEKTLRDWRETFYVCKCVYRRGPGFVEVRDRRRGLLIRFTIDDPLYLETIDVLVKGTLIDSVPTDVLTAFLKEDLVGVAGQKTWWLPHPVRRWPTPSMIV